MPDADRISRRRSESSKTCGRRQAGGEMLLFLSLAALPCWLLVACARGKSDGDYPDNAKNWMARCIEI